MSRKIGKFIHKSRYVSVFFLLLHVMGFFSSIDAVMGTRTSQGAIAWVISLNTFPIVSLPAYWIFGRSKFQGYVVARQQDESALANIITEVKKHDGKVLSDLSGRYPEARAAELLAELPTLEGNSAELLLDGEATFASIFDGIDRAREYILVQFFIVKNDELGRLLRDRLIRKAREGVKVYFLYDEVGSYKLPVSYLKELRENGVQAANFHSRKGPRNHFQVNFRNHRKVVVVDGTSCWIGGHNVGDEYLGKGGRFDHWRDTHVKLEGPATLAAQLSFLEDWHWATEQTLELEWKKALVRRGNKHVLIVPTGPADRFETAGLMFAHAINSATRRIWIASPYFVPDESIITSLQLAGLRGVDVRILIPDEPDHLLVYLAAFSYFQQVGKSGVKFYRYTKGFMHQKTMLIDDNLSAVGTANFDNRSFRLNFEITALIVDHDFNVRMEQMFTEDFSNADAMEIKDFSEKPYWFRLLVRLARLTSPML